MPVINGEKFACSSCIKGHRVSGCNHNDRELHHINPKGRPVKQCEHCRGARKSKSHHAKCDCGDKKDKDKLKDKVDAKGEITHDDSIDDTSNPAAVDESRCCCHSGGKCICGNKKDMTDLRLDTGKQTLHNARTKPKLTTTHSESTLTVFANGHHKPCHRNNNSAHVSGAPYKIPRPHTLHGPAFAALAQGNAYGQPDAPAQRSMDTLSLSNNDFYAMFGSAQRSVDSLPITPLTGNIDTTGIQDSLFTNQSPAFGQDGNSPSESHLSDTVSNQQWPWANTVTPVSRNFSYGSLSTSPSQDCLPNLENEWSIPSAGLDNALWSAGDLPLDSSKLNDTLAQPISHSGESKQSAPGLTTASSSQSEIGEPTWFGELEFRAPASAASESLFWEDSPPYPLATSAPIENLMAPTSVPTTSSPESQGLDLDFTKNLNPVSNAMNNTGASDYSEPAAIAMPNNIDDVVSNDPWLMDGSNSFGALNTFDMSYQTWF